MLKEASTKTPAHRGALYTTETEVLLETQRRYPKSSEVLLFLARFQLSRVGELVPQQILLKETRHLDL